MKRLITAILALTLCLIASGQTNSTIPPRYKLYKTENVYNLLKLDTATGAIWQVQYRMGKVKSMTSVIDTAPLVLSRKEQQPGRFELYPTDNIYTFILLDTRDGRTWQVQWNNDGPEKRFREPIF